MTNHPSIRAITFTPADAVNSVEGARNNLERAIAAHDHAKKFEPARVKHTYDRMMLMAERVHTAARIARGCIMCSDR